MKNELEIEFQLNEIFGFTDEAQQSHTQSIQKSTEAIDGFFEQLEIQKALGCHAGGAEKLTSSDCERSALGDLREFMKAEKDRVPTMTAREVRSSVVNVLRKAADAMATI